MLTLLLSLAVAGPGHKPVNFEPTGSVAEVRKALSREAKWLATDRPTSPKIQPNSAFVEGDVETSFDLNDAVISYCDYDDQKGLVSRVPGVRFATVCLLRCGASRLISIPDQTMITFSAQQLGESLVEAAYRRFCVEALRGVSEKEISNQMKNLKFEVRRTDGRISCTIWLSGGKEAYGKFMNVGPKPNVDIIEDPIHFWD